MGNKQSTLRQDVWQSVYDALAGFDAETRRKLSDDATERFIEARAATSAQPPVSQDARKGIEEDLTRGGYSYAKLRDKWGVGISTVQRVASDMRARGLTVRTAGQTLPGELVSA